MKANISQINLYQECPQKWYNRYVLGQDTLRPARALTIGIGFHHAMEVYYAQRKVSSPHEAARGEASAWLFKEAEKSPDAKVRAGLKDLSDKLIVMPEPRFYDPSKMIGVELVLEMPVGRHTLTGRLDGVVADRFNEGTIWHIQSRTLGLSTNMDSYNESRKMDPHELGYAAMLRHNYPYQVGGTISNFVKKGGLVNADKWYEDVLPIHWNLWDEYAKDLIPILDQMEELKLRYGKPLRNRAACRKVWGELCPYFNVCAGGDSLYGDNYRHIEPEYFDTPPEA